jgi:hypothetical protein
MFKDTKENRRLPWATAKVTDGPKPARRRLLDREDRPATPPVKATVPSFKHQENKRFLMKRALLAASHGELRVKG